MTFPIPSQFESEVNSLDIDVLGELNVDLADSISLKISCLTEIFEGTDNYKLSSGLTDWIDVSQTRELIAFSQWVLSRIVLLQFENKIDKSYCGKAIAIVRSTYQGKYKGIGGMKAEDIEDIESGALYPTTSALTYYADALNLSFEEFLDKVETNIGILKAIASKND